MGHQGNRDTREPCDGCDGEGRIEVMRMYARDPADTVMAVCEECNGNGVVACDYCGEDAQAAFTTHLNGATFYFCSAKCRLDDLGPSEEES